MKNKQWIIVAVILALAIFGIGILNYNAKMRVLKQTIQVQEDKKTKELRMTIKYNRCMDTAYEVYSANWNDECERFNRESDCTLPMYLVDRLDGLRETDEANCVKLYGN